MGHTIVLGRGDMILMIASLFITSTLLISIQIFVTSSVGYKFVGICHCDRRTMNMESPTNQ